MRWLSKKRKYINLRDWHEWFAWRPTRVNVMEGDSCTTYWVWLEWIRRRGVWRDNPDYGRGVHNDEVEGWWIWNYELK